MFAYVLTLNGAKYTLQSGDEIFIEHDLSQRQKKTSISFFVEQQAQAEILVEGQRHNEITVPNGPSDDIANLISLLTGFRLEKSGGYERGNFVIGDVYTLRVM